MICAAKLTKSTTARTKKINLQKRQSFVKVMTENAPMSYDDSSQRNGYDHIKGTSAKSDRRRCGPDDDRGPQWDPRLVDNGKRHIRDPNGEPRCNTVRGPRASVVSLQAQAIEVIVATKAHEANGAIGAKEESDTGKTTSESDHKDTEN